MEIKKVVRKMNFTEAEAADDEYWAKRSPEQRLQELVELRGMYFADEDVRIKKIVSIRSIFDEEN